MDARVAGDAERFDGFPYLVTRIGRTPLRHIALLPAGLPRAKLLDLSRKQVQANRLDTCLCLGATDAVFLDSRGGEVQTTTLPWGPVVVGLLQTTAPDEDGPEVVVRRTRLAAFADRHRGDGYLVGDGLESERLATPGELLRLSGSNPDGSPKGLVQCPSCAAFRGECLVPGGVQPDSQHGAVVAVHCRCDNNNRCARCGGPLADRRLSAWFYDEQARRVLYTAAYAALSHRCTTRARPSA